MNTRNKLTVFFCFILFVFLVSCSNQSEKQSYPTSEQEAVIPVTVTPETAPVAAEIPASGTDEEETIAAVANSGVETSTNVKEITMEMSNWKISMAPVTVKKGDTIKLTIKVAEGRHGFDMPAFDVKTGELGAGEEKTVTFVADKTGSFDYFCNVPCGTGHKEMRGKLVVEE